LRAKWPHQLVELGAHIFITASSRLDESFAFRML
jgi:hypothetical protein